MSAWQNTTAPLGLLYKLPVFVDINYGWQIEIASIASLVFAFISVALRSIARWRSAKLGWDDYLMIFAIIQSILSTAADYVSVNYGIGRHLNFLTIPQFGNAQLWEYIAHAFGLNALTCGKISLCITYLRIMQGSRRNMFLRWSIYVTCALTLVINSLAFTIELTQCMPYNKSWVAYTPGYCLQPTTIPIIMILQGSSSALTDYFLAASPFFLFKELQVSRSSRNILLFTMTLGVVASIFATIRTVDFVYFRNTPSLDPTFTPVSVIIWFGLERNFALMAASIPSIRPLAVSILKSVSAIFTKKISETTPNRITTATSVRESNHSSLHIGSYELNSKEISSPCVEIGETRHIPPNVSIRTRSGNDTLVSVNTMVISGTGSDELILPLQKSSYDGGMI